MTNKNSKTKAKNASKAYQLTSVYKNMQTNSVFFLKAFYT